MPGAHAIRTGNVAAPTMGTKFTTTAAAAARTVPGEQSTAGANVVLRRRNNACATCHHKKIRCDLDPSAYRPCSSCASLGISCRRRQRKPYASRKDSGAACKKAGSSLSSTITNNATAGAGAINTAANSTSDIGAGVDVVHSSIFSEPASTIATPATNLFSLADETVSSQRNGTHIRQLPSTSSANAHTDPKLIAVHDWETTASPNAAASAGDFSVSSSTRRPIVPATELFFSGDNYGHGHILDICNEGSVPSTQHHFIPRTAAPNMDKAALMYAEAKDCFAVIDHAICEEFIYAYFRYVHPMLPIIDIGEFLDRHWGISTEPISMLLLWSMFSVAASFVPEHTVRALDCEDRHQLKQLMFNRAKCLYMLDYEQDSVVVIQSCLPIGYWYSNLQDRTQSWHWTGIAISTAQTIGLHRNPDAKSHNRLLSTATRRLWRNLWWCCVSRDRWLAYGSGRPVRIKASDHDMPFPDGECMLLPPDPTLYSRTRLISLELFRLQFVFLGLLRLSIVLGDIIETVYRSQQQQAVENDVISSLAQRLRSCFLENTLDTSDATLIEFFTMYAQIHAEAATIALYRPFMTELARPPGQSDPVLTLAADTAVRKAASQTNALLDRMISADTLIFAGPTMVSLLIPAMTIHLHEVRSSHQFAKAWSHNRLDFCLLVLKHLENNYPAATLIHKLFVHARDKNCLPFGLSPGQDNTDQVADVADKGGVENSNDYDGCHYPLGKDLMTMPDAMLPTPSSNHQFSVADD